MICTEIREKLPLHLYGDLTSDDCANVEAHLAECAACRAEAAALAAVRRRLDDLPAPARTVDLAAIYRLETDRQRRRARRWGMATVLAAAVALLVLCLRLDIRANGRQLIVRWGEPEPTPVITHTVVEKTHEVVPSELDERLEVMTKLIHALAKNLKASDQERNQELKGLWLELGSLQQQSQQHWQETERDVKGLYTAQFGPRQSGANP